MLPKSSRFLAFGLLICSFVLATYLSGGTVARPTYAGLTVHEWGTFTSIAGGNGEAVEWLPLTGSTDLPSFVEHFRNAAFKRGLRGTVRMETPVLYFYDSREETVSVKVAFSKGLITEWYPRASRVEPTANVFDTSLYQPGPGGSIAWDSVTLAPNLRVELPQDNSGNHYYAARTTSSTPLRVKTSKGEQHEKFLFYRGVSTFRVPISATLAANGQVLLGNRSGANVPHYIVFERRGEKVGYRTGEGMQNEARLDAAELTANVNDLYRDLEGMLVAQGLYQDEAHAMVETWKDSWFEEGSRLLYIVPTSFVDGILPLSINPAPAHTTRVFVGRLELITPATEKAVQQALFTKDSATLEKYRRFLEPILTAMTQKEPDPAKAKELYEAMDSFYNSKLAVKLFEN
jgi:hypothetical protein